MKYLLIIITIFSNMVFSSISKSCVPQDIYPLAIYWGGGAELDRKSIEALKNYSVVVFDRWRYFEVGKESWGSIKELNPKIKIFVYQLGTKVSVDDKKTDIRFLNNIERLDSVRGQSKGTVLDNHFLLDKDYAVRGKGSSDKYQWVDFSRQDYIDYWCAATINDIVQQEYVADGVFVGETTLLNPHGLVIGKKLPHHLDTVDEWNQAMNKFTLGVTQCLQAKQQEVMVNRGGTRLQSGFNAWVGLQQSNNLPNILVEEGAFAVSWGKGNVQFFSEQEWNRQVSVTNIKTSVAYLSHANFNGQPRGLDLQGRLVNSEQVFWFALGSYMLAKSANCKTPTYFFYENRSSGDFKSLAINYDYKNIKLGLPIGTYKRKLLKGHNIYYRNFSNGIVYVNPGQASIDKICLSRVDKVIPAQNQSFLKRNVNWGLNKNGIKLIAEQCENYLELPPHSAVILQCKDGCKGGV